MESKRYSVTRTRRDDNDSPRSPKRRNPLYERNGALSPLRSPVNRKETRRSPRKSPSKYRRTISQSSSSSWADMTEDFEKTQEEVKQYKERVGPRKDSLGSSISTESAATEIETDEEVLLRRQKQIDYGKTTDSYEAYHDAIPRDRRIFGKHPNTPNKFVKCSRRKWDGMVKAWKLQIHRSVNGSATPPTSCSSTSTTPRSEQKPSSKDEQKEFRKQLKFGGEKLHINDNDMDLN